MINYNIPILTDQNLVFQLYYQLLIIGFFDDYFNEFTLKFLENLIEEDILEFNYLLNNNNSLNDNVEFFFDSDICCNSSKRMFSDVEYLLSLNRKDRQIVLNSLKEQKREEIINSKDYKNQNLDYLEKEYSVDNYDDISMDGIHDRLIFNHTQKSNEYNWYCQILYNFLKKLGFNYTKLIKNEDHVPFFNSYSNAFPIFFQKIYDPQTRCEVMHELYNYSFNNKIDRRLIIDPSFLTNLSIIEYNFNNEDGLYLVEGLVPFANANEIYLFPTYYDVVTPENVLLFRLEHIQGGDLLIKDDKKKYQIPYIDVGPVDWEILFADDVKLGKKKKIPLICKNIEQTEIPNLINFLIKNVLKTIYSEFPDDFIKIKKQSFLFILQQNPTVYDKKFICKWNIEELIAVVEKEG